MDFDGGMWQDAVGALQVETEGVWIDAAALVKGDYVVNIGEVFERDD